MQAYTLTQPRLSLWQWLIAAAARATAGLVHWGRLYWTIFEY